MRTADEGRQMHFGPRILLDGTANSQSSTVVLQISSQCSGIVCGQNETTRGRGGLLMTAPTSVKLWLGRILTGQC